MVLAHELGHFRLRHHLRGLGRGAILLAMMIVLGGEPEANSFISPSSQLVSLSFSRADEAAADEYALDTLHRAVGHVGGATDFFDKLAAMELSLPGMSYLSTHPRSSDRVQALRSMISERGYRELALDPKPQIFPQ
jgi:predicted Zn-dependent protease